MKRESLAPRASCLAAAAAALILTGLLAATPPARADVDVRLDIGNAPPAPSVYFRSEPHRVYDSAAGVYVVDDPDLGDVDAFEYGGYVWMFSDGFWYRSTGWDADFAVVSPRDVPMQVYEVPASSWHHHPSYDSVHLRGWHARDWQDRDVLRDEGVVRDNSGGQDVRDDDTRYRDDSGSNSGYRVERHHHHGVHLGVDASVRIHRTHHHHHVDRGDRAVDDRRRDRDDRDDR